MYFCFYHWECFSYCLYLMVLMNPMNNTFRTNTITKAIKAKVRNIFIWVLFTATFSRKRLPLILLHWLIRTLLIKIVFYYLRCWKLRFFFEILNWRRKRDLFVMVQILLKIILLVIVLKLLRLDKYILKENWGDSL